jgi:hypothetical protein
MSRAAAASLSKTMIVIPSGKGETDYAIEFPPIKIRLSSIGTPHRKSSHRYCSSHLSVRGQVAEGISGIPVSENTSWNASGFLGRNSLVAVSLEHFWKAPNSKTNRAGLPRKGVHIV